MKVAPVMRAIAALPAFHQTLVHTGQHYDVSMSDRFFTELAIPAPDVNLDVRSGTHAQQTARIMEGIDECLSSKRPDIVMVYGDVNSTMAAALVAVKRGIAVGHVEAGLRSQDLSMPEEINRLVTDRIATYFYTPSADADAHLLAEGVRPSSIQLVGNVMIDTLVRLLPMANAAPLLKELGLETSDGLSFVLVTLHRPSNVDDAGVLAGILDVLVEIAGRAPVILPLHPRTRSRVDLTALSGIRVVDPLSYLEFLDLQRQARLVITDSGGVQEETTFLGVPCLTVRENTERPVTVNLGTNTLVGQDPSRLREEAFRVLDGHAKRGSVPPLWDGHAGERIAQHLSTL